MRWILGGVGALLLLLIIIGIANPQPPTPTTTAAASTAPSTTTTEAPPPSTVTVTASTSSVAPVAPVAPPSSAAPAPTGVVYEVTGSGRANNITYGDVSKGLSQSNGERLPWTKTMPAAEGFGIYGLTAQNGGSGQISCRITVNGQEIATNTSSGLYAVVSCNGTTSAF